MNQKFELKSAEMRLNNPARKELRDGNTTNYKTYERAANVRKLLLELPDGTIEVLDYAYLMRAKYNAQDGSITLFYTWGNVVLNGERLKMLIRNFCINTPMEILCIDERYTRLAVGDDFVLKVFQVEK